MRKCLQTSKPSIGQERSSKVCVFYSPAVESRYDYACLSLKFEVSFMCITCQHRVQTLPTEIDPKGYNLPDVGAHSFLLDPQPESVFYGWYIMVSNSEFRHVCSLKRVSLINIHSQIHDHRKISLSPIKYFIFLEEFQSYLHVQ